MAIPNHSRRTFLKTSLGAAAAVGFPTIVPSTVLGQDAPSNRINIGAIGVGRISRVHDMPGVWKYTTGARNNRIIAVCDLYAPRVEQGKQLLNGVYSKQTGKDYNATIGYSDYRELLSNKDIDAVIISTPDHQHARLAVAAVRAKKDVYLQKPASLTIAEGRFMSDHVMSSGQILQIGSQQRSWKQFYRACELVRNGRIGKIQEVDVFVPAGLRAGPFQTRPVPGGLHWDLWQGQTAGVDYMPERCHGTFRWWWDYAGGPVTDWGAHHNDIARWGIGQEGPLDVEAKVVTGPIPGGYTTPSEFEATLTWANGVTQIVKTTPDDSPYGAVLKRDGQRNGIRFEGTDGWIWVNRDGFSASNEDLATEPLPANAVRLESSGNHMKNFFDCVKSRKDPVSAVETGHRSAVVGHLIVIALRLGRKFQWDPAKEVFIGDGAAEGNACLAREMRKPYDLSMVG